jgi:hypothetical protein
MFVPRAGWSIIGLPAGEPAVMDNLARADQVFVPTIAIGQLCFGAVHRSNSA